MRTEEYINQTLAFIRSKIDNMTGDQLEVEEVSSYISEKLILIDDHEDRKRLIKRVLEEIQDINVINKYRRLYLGDSSSEHLTNSITNFSNRIRFNFNSLMY